MIRPHAITALILVLASACGGAVAPSASPGPTPTAQPTVAPTPTLTPSPTLAHLRVGVLPAGTYVTNRFVPPLTLTLNEGWRLLFQDEEDEIAFERSGPAFFGISFAAQVVDQATGRAIPAPDDLVAWLGSHPALDAGQPTPVTVAGVTGWSLEAAVNTVPNMDVFAHPEGDYHVVAGERIRIYVLPFDGPDLVILFSTAADSFDALAAEMQPVIDSIELDAS